MTQATAKNGPVWIQLKENVFDFTAQDIAISAEVSNRSVAE